MSETAERRIDWRDLTQKIIVGVLLTVIISGGVWVGKMQEQHKVFQSDINTIKSAVVEECNERKLAVGEEREERKAEYLQLKMKLIDMEVQLQRIDTGQEWIILKLKGEL